MASGARKPAKRTLPLRDRREARGTPTHQRNPIPQAFVLSATPAGSPAPSVRQSTYLDEFEAGQETKPHSRALYFHHRMYGHV